MRFEARIEGDLDGLMRREVWAGERAVSATMKGAAASIKGNWRGQVTGAGLGTRLGNTIRSRVYPQGETSLNAAALVWSKAPHIIGAHDRGEVVRSKNGFWLAIPLPAAGRGRRGKRPTPHDWEERTGRRLKFIYRRGRSALLIDDGTYRDRKTADRFDFRHSRKRGRRNLVIPVFALVPQARLKKRLNLMPEAERTAALVPGQIVSTWEGLTR